jgi:pimeloyl-ACP methyl ester carboxylesterase
MMLTPARTRTEEKPPLRHVAVTIPGDDVVLRGWLFPAEHSRGTVIFLHGRNQNRSAGVAVAERLVGLGYDVLVYDSRGHGDSGGTYSTFGYWEKRDLSRAIDYLGTDRVVAMGVSLGGAVAIQDAAEDPRIIEVIAVSAFASMREAVRDRVPVFLRAGALEPAFREAEALGHMKVDGADTAAAARSVRVPTLLLHGTGDTVVPPVQAREIEAALVGPSELVMVPGAGHDDVLASELAWRAILQWIEAPPHLGSVAHGPPDDWVPRA